MVLALLAAAVMLSGCGGADEGSSGESADKQAPAAGNDSGGTDGDGAGQSSSDGDDEAAAPDTAARVLPAGRDIVYRGQISVRVKNVTTAADKVESLTGAVDGVVFSEESSNVPGSPSESSATMTLRVPPAEFRSTLKKLAGLGQRLSQTQTAEDVTTQVVDAKSRLATQQRSVARVRALLGEAKTIGEVVQVESELAKREADLESLEAQAARLEDVTEQATIEVSLVGPDAEAPVEEEDLGFLAGLRGGWDAFVQIMLVGLTVLGALLPFLLTAALIAVPAWLIFRPRHVRRPQPPTADVVSEVSR
jgi:hypothetical protein